MATKRTAPPALEPAGPLPTATFHILLALVDGERHGYAIMKEVADTTDGAVKIGAGTLYGALKRMRDAGWIEELDERSDPELGDDRRRYYQLTRNGLAVVRAEARRLGQMVLAAQAKKLIGPSLRFGTGPSLRFGTGPSLRFGTGPSLRFGTGPSLRFGTGPSLRFGTGLAPLLGAGPKLV
jgi:DNA-binding PadR family transcriptional regulator